MVLGTVGIMTGFFLAVIVLGLGWFAYLKHAGGGRRPRTDHAALYIDNPTYPAIDQPYAYQEIDQAPTRRAISPGRATHRALPAAPEHVYVEVVGERVPGRKEIRR